MATLEAMAARRRQASLDMEAACRRLSETVGIATPVIPPSRDPVLAHVLLVETLARWMSEFSVPLHRKVEAARQDAVAALAEDCGFTSPADLLAHFQTAPPTTSEDAPTHDAPKKKG